MKFLVTLLLGVLVCQGSSVPVQKWLKSSDGCPYYVENDQKFNWYQAWEECLNKNMTLLALDTLYKQEQIDGLIKHTFRKNITVWLAGHDNAVDQRYVWANTGKMLSFTNWATSQPNRQPNDHCILIHDSTNQWHDFPCATKLGFICEDYQCTQDKSPERIGNSLKSYNIAVWNLNASTK